MLRLLHFDFPRLRHKVVSRSLNALLKQVKSKGGDYETITVLDLLNDVNLEVTTVRD